MMTTRDGSPFECSACTDKDRIQRNCLNHVGLTEDARGVTEFTEEVKDELREKGAAKVFTLAGMRLYECPLSYITTETWDIVGMIYLMDDSSALLHPGGLGSQPAWLIQAYEIYRVESLRSVKDNDAIKSTTR